MACACCVRHACYDVPRLISQTRFMKRLLVIFLLVILPHQFSWAAAAVYCEHGQSTSGKHFGHHEHKFDADYHAKNGDADLAKVHGDCGYCHAAALQAFFSVPLLPVVFEPPRVYLDTPPTHFTSHFPEGPRRPDRLPAA